MRYATLRRVMASWDATGRIRPIWEKLEGPAKRDRFAELSGVRATELSAHNQGKPLGPKVAAKIIAGAAKAGITISNVDLGAPVGEADETGLILLDRLRSVEALAAENRDGLAEMLERLDSLEAALADASRRRPQRRKV